MRFRYKNYIYSESGDPAECYRHKKLCKNDQLRCAAARGASKHFLHSHGRNFCTILFKFGHDVAWSHPESHRRQQIFKGGPSSPHTYMRFSLELWVVQIWKRCQWKEIVSLWRRGYKRKKIPGGSDGGGRGTDPLEKHIFAKTFIYCDRKQSAG